MTLLFGGARSPAMTLERALDLPMSPGAMALLIRHAQQPAARERIAQGLQANDPSIRAAAARVTAVTRAQGLHGQLLAALGKETFLFAAREEIRALVFSFEPDDEPRLVEAARRFGWQMSENLGVLLAREQGLGALPVYFSALRSPEWTVGARQEFFDLATHHQENRLEQLAAAALESGDSQDWRAVLAVVSGDEFELEHGIAMSALTQANTAISSSTAWLVSRQYAAMRPDNANEIIGVLGSAAPAADSADPDDAFGREMLLRVLGLAPVSNTAWIERLDRPGPVAMDDGNAGPALRDFLTPQEAKALKARYEKHLQPGQKLPKWLSGKKSRQDLKGPRAADGTPEPVVRTIAGLSPGLVRDLLAVTGCEYKRDLLPHVVDANVIYDTSGRPRRIIVSPVSGSEGCVDAFEAVFAAALAPDGYLPDPAIEERLILFEDQEFLSHIDDEPFQSTSTSMWDARPIEPPKRTKFVAPQYPARATNNREEGKAILDVCVTKDGHVIDLRTVESTKPAFLINAIWAISQWSYMPAVLDGEPVPVRLTVIVEYKL